MKAFTALRVILYCCLAVPAAAQSTFAGLHLSGRPMLYLTEASGRETKGRLASLTDDALTITVKKSTRTFTPDELRLIERRGDSLGNGIAAGLVIAGVCLFTCAQGVSSGGQLAKVAFVNGLFPVALDAVHIGRTRVWPGPPGP